MLVLKKTLKALRSAAASAAALTLMAGLSAAPASAQELDSLGRVSSERYAPTVWVDPDGCEHWVMDDGVEGYMTPHVNRQGIPVCRRGNVCGVMKSDQLFATDSAAISATGKRRLAEFFRASRARGFIVAGHTDARASDAYNMDLSYRRAASVARIGKATGVRIVDVRGYGERRPVATNRTAAGMQQNRRVEIICVK